MHAHNLGSALRGVHFRTVKSACRMEQQQPAKICSAFRESFCSSEHHFFAMLRSLGGTWACVRNLATVSATQSSRSVESEDDA
eukprot:208956-Amphidinium_carterae.1